MHWQIKFPLAKNTFNKIPVVFERVSVTTSETDCNHRTVKFYKKSSKKLDVALVNFQTTVKNLLAKSIKQQQHLVQFRVPFGMSLTFPCKLFCDDNQLSFKEINFKMSYSDVVDVVTEPNSIILIDSTMIGEDVREHVDDIVPHYYSTNQLNGLICCVVHS